MKIDYIDSLHIFLTTRGISIKFSGKVRLMIMLEVTEYQGCTLSLEDTFFFEKLQGEWFKLTHQPF